MYTTVLDRSGAVAAAARLARDGDGGAAVPADDLCSALPLLVDQVMAEAGVVEPRVCARALRQARGDVARAVSLVRAWAATLPVRGVSTVGRDRMRVLRRITPAFAQPPGGQYLGATLDYAQRLLDLDGSHPAPGAGGTWGERPRSTEPPNHPEPSEPLEAAAPGGPVPAPVPPPALPRALAALERRGVVAEPLPRAEAVDVRRSTGGRAGRGALLMRLASGETGAMTALAYSGIRGRGQRSDPTLVELRQGMLPVTIAHPVSGEEVRVGEVAATCAEVVLYRVHDGLADPRLTVGVGATCGRVERRAISAALLDANCARAAPGGAPDSPCDDREFLDLVLDGQEAAGFVEHLKLPHHVTFTSDLERLGSLRGPAGDGAPDGT